MSGQAARLGFTLAEVLITLGIIGVVAALTMPVLVANYSKKADVAKLKKAYTVIRNTGKTPMILVRRFILKNIGNIIFKEHRYVRHIKNVVIIQ